jgi:peptidylprolyl isomerase
MIMKPFVLAALAATSFLAAKPALPGLTTTPSGLQFVDTRPGHGKVPEIGQTCAVLYRGWLYPNQRRGKLFDSAQNAKQPFRFPVGLGQVIAGWDEGIKSMKAGGKRVLIIPPSLGYGAKGAGDDIPPDATLLFEVELLSFK